MNQIMACSGKNVPRQTRIGKDQRVPGLLGLALRPKGAGVQMAPFRPGSSLQHVTEHEPDQCQPRREAENAQYDT